MKEQSQEREIQHLDKIDGACLIIECDSNGELSFSCDWQADETGITCMATIFTFLDDEQTTSKIIDNIADIYSSEEQAIQIEKLKRFYVALKNIANQHKQKADDQVVIPPLDANPLI